METFNSCFFVVFFFVDSIFPRHLIWYTNLSLFFNLDRLHVWIRHWRNFRWTNFGTIFSNLWWLLMANAAHERRMVHYLEWKDLKWYFLYWILKYWNLFKIFSSSIYSIHCILVNPLKCIGFCVASIINPRYFRNLNGYKYQSVSANNTEIAK